MDAHENLSLAIANRVVADEESVTRVDASLAGLGAGPGTARSARMSPWPQLHGWEHVADLSRSRTRLWSWSGHGWTDRTRVDRETLTSGYAGGLFQLPPTRRAGLGDVRLGRAFNPAGAGRRGLVGRKEDLTVDIVLDLGRAG